MSHTARNLFIDGFVSGSPKMMMIKMRMGKVLISQAMAVMMITFVSLRLLKLYFGWRCNNVYNVQCVSTQE